jgi:hypothetical protein
LTISRNKNKIPETLVRRTRENSLGVSAKKKKKSVGSVEYLKPKF